MEKTGEWEGSQRLSSRFALRFPDYAAAHVSPSVFSSREGWLASSLASPLFSSHEYERRSVSGASRCKGAKDFAPNLEACRHPRDACDYRSTGEIYHSIASTAAAAFAFLISIPLQPAKLTDSLTRDLLVSSSLVSFILFPLRTFFPRLPVPSHSVSFFLLFLFSSFALSPHH